MKLLFRTRLGINMLLLRILCAVPLLLCLCRLDAQALHKCTDANGKITLQDVPCVSGVASTVGVQPASGGDKSKEQGKQATKDIDALRNDVALMRAQREHRDAKHQIEVYTSRLDGFSLHRAATYKARDMYVLCAPGARVMCLDTDNRAKVDRELEFEFNSLLSARATGEADRRKANREHYELTKKWLD